MKKRKMTYLVMAAALLAACSSDKEAQEPEGRLPISLGYTTVELDQTRAGNGINETQLTSGTVKVNMKKHSADSWGTAVDYTAGTGGTLSATTPFYYESDGTTVDIIAYYPADAGTSFTVADDQSSDDKYQESDLMWATPIINQSRTPATVTLQLNHKMAKISVKPIMGSGVTKITKVTLKGIKPTVTFDQTTGVVGAASGDATEIIVAKNEDGLTAGDYYAALIPEQTLAAGAFVEIMADGHAATYSLASSKTFYAGHQYSLDITVDASALNAENTIGPWDDTEATIVGGANLVNPLTIDDIADQAYTGSAITPAVSVSFNGNTITEGYDVYYVDNTNPGKATAVVSYNGMYGAKEFNILAPNINSSTITSANVGWIVGNNGKAYPNTTVLGEDAATGVAMIAYVGTNSNCSHGLAIALTDASNSCLGNSAEAAVSTWGSSHSVSLGAWRLPSADDFKYMGEACGGSVYTSETTMYMRYSYGNLRNMLIDLGDYDVQEGYYWTSTPQGDNWLIDYNFTAPGSFDWHTVSTLSSNVRAVLAF